MTAIDRRFATAADYERARQADAASAIHDQQQAEAALIRLRDRTLADFRRLAFPIGYPVRGYDWEHVEALINEAMTPTEEKTNA